MSERIDRLMQAAGLQENVLNSLERGDSVFVLTDQTLLFQDGGGTRRVTLRDLKRIHSDHDGLLRVETPAGTALTANLVGFDPAAVQSFFAQVRDATGRAKQPAGDSRAPAAGSAPAPAAPTTPPPRSAPVSPMPVNPAPASLTPANPIQTSPIQTNPVLSNPVPPARPAPPAAGSRMTAAPATPSAVAPTPPTPKPPAFRSPQEEQPATAKAAVKPVVKAVRTPAVVTDPALLAEKPAETAADLAAPLAPAARLPGSAAGTLASLAAVAGGVTRWVGALKFMSVVMLLATFGMAYFLYGQGQGISGFWTLIAGGMGAVALWALSDVVKLLVALALAVSAEGGVMDVD